MNKIVIITLIIFLAITLLLCFFLYKYARWYYSEVNEMRLDPIGSINSSWKSRKQFSNLIILGDSRAASWQIIDFGGTINNLGINGFTSEQLRNRLQIDSIQFDNSIVLLQVGVNDFKSIPLFPERKEAIILRTAENISEIIKRCINKGAARVVVSTVFPLGKLDLVRRPFWSGDFNDAILAVNKFIRSYKSPKVEIFDASAILEDGTCGLAWGNKIYFSDFLHLNAQGYDLLNKSLLIIINKP